MEPAPKPSILQQRGGVWTVIGLLLVAGIAALLIIQVLPKTPPAPAIPDAPRHLIVISIDALRADFLGCYGRKQARTPVIDKLAAEGVLFERHYTCYPLTLPAHLTQLTGVSTLGHRVRDNLYHRLPEQLVTLPEVLGRNGFTSAAFVSAYTMHAGSGIERGFDHYDDEGVREIAPGRNTITERKAGDTLARAAAWLEKQGQAKRLFCFIHLFDPHAPYDAPAAFKSHFESTTEGLYDAEIAYTDHCLGIFIERLRALGIFDNALVVVTADHGEGLGQHNELTHGFFCYDTTTHVPLIVRGAKKVQSGVRAGAVNRNYDLAPTLLELLGLEDAAFARQFHGRSLAELLTDPDRDLGLVAYVESHYGYINTGWAKIRGLRSRQGLTLFSGELVQRFEDDAQKVNLATERAAQVTADREEVVRLLASLRPPAGAKVGGSRNPGMGTPYPGESASDQSFEPENMTDTRDLKPPTTQAQVLMRYQEAEIAYDEERFEVCADLLTRLAADAPDFVPGHKLLAAVCQILARARTTETTRARELARRAFDSLLAAASHVEKFSGGEAALRMRLNAALLALWLGSDSLFEKACAPHRTAPPPDLEWLMLLNRYVRDSKDKQTLEAAEAFVTSGKLGGRVLEDARKTLELMRKGERLKLAPWNQQVSDK